ncbi:MAG: hypothetical protein H0U49_04625, partial [Parachlamydiaceae bacterium]|nr:hypothetical protein [Parachlamydiaceae bacterium]
MIKEPIILTVLRYLFFFGILGFLGMLYWSSLIIEEELKVIHEELSQLKSDQFSGYRATENKTEDKANALIQESKGTENKKEALTNQTTPINRSPTARKQIDPSLPNLLKEDPFYANMLPKLLGEGFKPKGQLRQAS